MLLGAFVKGTLGIGMPLMAVPLLSLFIPATQVIALMAVPVLVSNPGRPGTAACRGTACCASRR